MRNMTTSKGMASAINQEKHTLKLYGTLVGDASATKHYYFKPSFACRVVNAALLISTAAGAALSAVGTLTKETAVTTISPDTLTKKTATGVGTAVSDDDLMKCPVGVNSLGKLHFYPGANYQGTENRFYPEKNDAMIVSLTFQSGTALSSVLELEVQPIA